MNCIHRSFYSLKLYFYKKNSLLITECVFWRYLFSKFDTFRHVRGKVWARVIKLWSFGSIWTNHDNSNRQIMDVAYFSRFAEHDKVGINLLISISINLRP